MGSTGPGPVSRCGPRSGWTASEMHRPGLLRRREMTVSRLVARKAVHVAAVLLVVSAATLALLELTPGGPAYAILGEDSTPEQVKALNARLGVDRPVPVRYADWITDAARGDLGESLISGRPVAGLISQRLPVTLELAALALVIALAVSVPLAMVAAYRADRPIDKVTAATSSLLISSPQFLTGLFLVYFFAVENRWFPATGWRYLGDGLDDNLRHAFLPAVTLALAEIPVFTRVLRADLVTTLQEDFILSARARGTSTVRILFVHALRPSSFSLITLAGLSLGSLVGGAVIVENVFAVPGLGQLMIQSILNKDLPVVQGVVLVIAASYVLVNAAVDVAYAYLDPRVRSTQVRGA
jgi:peptide/nickel transport system permease protein